MSTRPTTKYEWAGKVLGFKPIDPNATGNELERIRKAHGELTPTDVVDESRPEDAVLHPCFEWDDEVAAGRWRVRQARKIVQCIGIRYKTEDGGEGEVKRYYVSVKKAGTRSYIRIPEALADDEIRALVLEELRLAIQSIERKYQGYKELAEIFTHVNKVIENLGPSKPGRKAAQPSPPTPISDTVRAVTDGAGL